jgi:hypothetical protein
MGISQILGAIVAIMIALVVGIGVVHFYDNSAKNQNIIVIAQRTADYDNVFMQALDSYVKANVNSAGGQVTCANLQTAGYLDKSYDCVDPLGETLTGYVSSPWGFPQTWFMTVAGYPSNITEELDKYGINSTLKWKAFEYQVVQDLTNSQDTGVVINSSNDFSEPQTTAVSALSDYFPSSNVYSPQTMPSLSTLEGFNIMDGHFQLNPGYWIIQAQEDDTYSGAYLNMVNMGYSASCPLSDNGVLPVNVPSDDILTSTGIINLQNGGLIWGFSGSIYNIFNFCLPATRTLVNSSYVFPSASNTDTNLSDSNNYPCSQINFELSNGTWENGCSANSSQTAIVYIGVPVQPGDNFLPNWAGTWVYYTATIPDLNAYYIIKVGNINYTLIVSMGNTSANDDYNAPWRSYISATLWFGNLSGSLSLNPLAMVGDEVVPSEDPIINYNLRDMGTFIF